MSSLTIPPTQQHHSKSKSPLDWLIPSSNTTDITYAADVDIFESELDLSLQGYDQAQLQLLSDFDFTGHNNAFFGVRNDGGPLSTITVSSESAYDSLSSHSESLYGLSNNNGSPSGSGNGLDDFNLDFSSFSVEANATESKPTANDDALSFLGVPSQWASEKPQTKPAGQSAPALYVSGLTALGPSKLTPARFPMGSVSLDAIHMAPQPTHAVAMHNYPSQPTDPRKKYSCPNCPRSFARAFNLKTHMATHDPNRPKPHVCPHPTCNRSFSRKHDLGRHLISIHREDHPSASALAQMSRGIGIAGGARNWCEACGKSWAGRQRTCGCDVLVGHDAEVK